MEYEAIVVIVERGRANDVVKKAAEAGARGATIVYGRGAGEHVVSFFRSLHVEPAKELILIIMPKEEVKGVFDVVLDAARVREKGKGIAFCVPIGNVNGIGTGIE